MIALQSKQLTMHRTEGNFSGVNLGKFATKHIWENKIWQLKFVHLQFYCYETKRDSSYCSTMLMSIHDACCAKYI